MDFQVGDIVELKSGGPYMTVVGHAGGGSVICEWFNNEDGKQTPARHVFPPQALKKKPAEADF